MGFGLIETYYERTKGNSILRGNGNLQRIQELNYDQTRPRSEFSKNAIYYPPSQNAIFSVETHILE